MCGSKCNLMYSICNSLMYKMLYYQILCIRKICMCGKKPVALLVTYILHFNSSHLFFIYIFLEDTTQLFLFKEIQFDTLDVNHF